jgi:hypothetical protein
MFEAEQGDPDSLRRSNLDVTTKITKSRIRKLRFLVHRCDAQSISRRYLFLTASLLVQMRENFLLNPNFEEQRFWAGSPFCFHWDKNHTSAAILVMFRRGPGMLGGEGRLCLAKIPSLSVLLGLRWRIAGVLGTDIYC